VWPAGFARIPDDDWTRSPLETLALKYDTVENHGWYHNLDRTVSDVGAALKDGQILVDYSGGTGIFLDRLLHAHPGRRAGFAIVDASPKFLRLALEKFRQDERVDEVLSVPADLLVSTNAVHLYYDLVDTMKGWARLLRPGARAFVQSGNIRNPAARAGEWIIDETVEAIHRSASDIVRRDARWTSHRAVLDDAARMREHDALRRKYFLPVRPLDYYVGALREAGFAVESSATGTIEARVDEWYQFLSVYHEGVLGWVGGSEKVEGRAPGERDVADRLALLRESMRVVFGGASSFPCCWTYLTARR
jgi:SAM-dependent methyltransferase